MEIINEDFNEENELLRSNPLYAEAVKLWNTEEGKKSIKNAK